MRAVPGFKVDVRRDGLTAVIAPSGEVDLATVDQLWDAFGETKGCSVVVLDLRGVPFMDSAGLSLVVGEHRRALREGFEFRVVRGSVAVQRLFEMTGLAQQLRFTPAVSPDADAGALGA